MPAHKPFPCAYSAMAQRGSNQVVLLNTGSYPGFSNLLNTTYGWNGVDWNQASGLIDGYSPLPVRKDFAMSYDGYNVMVFGGRGDNSLVGPLSDTWTWNGSAWTKQAPLASPFGRFKAKAGLITSTLKTALFGGAGALKQLNETWVWDGNALTWTKAAPATSPSARIDFAFSGGPTFCVLFGGSNTNSNLGDTWKFDGTNWTQLTPTGSPSFRAEASMCYDTANSVWVLFGGKDGAGMLGDTYTLNAGGTAWTKQAPAASPSNRAGAQMCYDSQSGAVLLMGGTNGTDTLQDTWKWTGTNWVQL